MKNSIRVLLGNMGEAPRKWAIINFEKKKFQMKNDNNCISVFL